MNFIVIVSEPMSPLKDVYYFQSEDAARNFVPKRGIVEKIAMITEL
jgi:hypothetical protein